MKLLEGGCLLRIFIGESDKHVGIPLYDWIVKQAREHRMAGATVIRGLEGFGAHGHLYTVKFLRQSMDQPIIVEIVDSREKIESFLPVIDGAIAEGLATVEKVDVRFYRGES